MKWKARMVQSLLRELELRASSFKESINTIYFGGGTPSVLNIDQINLILEKIRDLYSTDIQEITFEANPEDLNEAFLKGLKSLGINRLSIGIQSFDDSLLKSVNRNHTVDDAYEAVRNALKTGFGDINLDLIYALPGSSRQTLQSDLNKITELSPEHISIYSYTVENKTVFENWLKKGKIELITEDEEADQYQMIIDHFKKEGYQQYEISNFAKERHYSKHNSSYWNLTPYLGIGPSAHSLHNNKRWSNTSNNSQYMQAIESGSFPSQIEILSNETLSSEYIFTSIRTIWGCDLNKLVNDFGVDLLDKNRIEIDKLIQSEHIIIEGDQLSLTERGKLLADEIASRLYILEDNIE